MSAPVAAADQRPPRFAGDERETLCALWQYHRESLVRKVSGISDDDADRRLVGSETTLRWLVWHLADAERLWVVGRFAGREDDSRPAAGTARDAIAVYEQTWSVVDEVVAGASLDDLARVPVHGDTGPVNLRWIVTHLLEETARHAGHADILRELIDGSTGR